jgi:membrane-associated phospholipid phosphatase
MNLLYDLGEYGPIILVFLSWYLLRDHKNLFFYYTVGIFLNSIINIILKGIIQQPRPMYDSDKVRLLKTYGKHYLFQNGIPFDIFGMPSGHAQMCLFSTIYIYLVFKKIEYLYIYIPLSILTCYQRVKLSYHSISQVLVGTLVGSLFAYIVYIFGMEKIKGKIREKSDDFGPN